MFDVGGKMVASAELLKTAKCQSLECVKFTGLNPYNYQAYGRLLFQIREEFVQREEIGSYTKCRRGRHSVPTLGD